MICFQISIFEPLETTSGEQLFRTQVLWFAFKLVSLNHWKQLRFGILARRCVVICFQISIFEPLETTSYGTVPCTCSLWFAFKLVSLNHWKQHHDRLPCAVVVVICFQISIFEPLETTTVLISPRRWGLWFAFKLVSLNHWKQQKYCLYHSDLVVICFQISIFEPLETTWGWEPCTMQALWFAFKLVSLNHWKQLNSDGAEIPLSCDLLSN